MRTTACPASARRRRDEKSAVASCGARTAVGSSRMRTAGSAASAPAIPIRWRVPTGSSATIASGSPRSRSYDRARRRTRRRRADGGSTKGADRSRSARLSATVAASTRRSCCGDEGDPAPARFACRPERSLAAAEADRPPRPGGARPRWRRASICRRRSRRGGRGSRRRRSSARPRRAPASRRISSRFRAARGGLTIPSEGVSSSRQRHRGRRSRHPLRNSPGAPSSSRMRSRPRRARLRRGRRPEPSPSATGSRRRR